MERARFFQDFLAIRAENTIPQRFDVVFDQLGSQVVPSLNIMFQKITFILTIKYLQNQGIQRAPCGLERGQQQVIVLCIKCSPLTFRFYKRISFIVPN